MKKTGRQIASELRDHFRVQDSYFAEVKALDEEQRQCKDYDEANGCSGCKQYLDCELRQRIAKKDTVWVEAVIKKDRFLKVNLETICNILERSG